MMEELYLQKITFAVGITWKFVFENNPPQADFFGNAGSKSFGKYTKIWFQQYFTTRNVKKSARAAHQEDLQSTKLFYSIFD